MRRRLNEPQELYAYYTEKTMSNTPSTTNRIPRCFALRTATAANDAFIAAPPQVDNGDEALYSDKSGTYTKGVLQTGVGLVDLAAYRSFKKALESGNPADFEAITLGGPRTLNGPQGGLAFDLECLDSSQFPVPPAPALASEAYATELVELYWASLLRDVAFTDYASNPTAALAANELSSMPTYAGPRDNGGHVTPDLLFRGGFPGETVGPNISQLFITPTYFGQQELSQQMTTYLPGIDYMTDLITWQQVQNGIDTGLRNQTDSQPRFQFNGRSLSAYTHVDVLYQAYFTAFLVLNTLGAPLNPGNPYVHSKTQNGFSTFGGPDIAASLGGIAARALDVVWYHKWMVHLRHRPESGGGLVQLIETGQG